MKQYTHRAKFKKQRNIAKATWQSTVTVVDHRIVGTLDPVSTQIRTHALIN